MSPERSTRYSVCARSRRSAVSGVIRLALNRFTSNTHIYIYQRRLSVRNHMRIVTVSFIPEGKIYTLVYYENNNTLQLRDKRFCRNM